MGSPKAKLLYLWKGCILHAFSTWIWPLNPYTYRHTHLRNWDIPFVTEELSVSTMGLLVRRFVVQGHTVGVGFGITHQHGSFQTSVCLPWNSAKGRIGNSSPLTAAVKLEHPFDEARHKPYFQKHVCEALEVVIQDGSANVLFKKHYSIQNEIFFFSFESRQSTEVLPDQSQLFEIGYLICFV